MFMNNDASQIYMMHIYVHAEILCYIYIPGVSMHPIMNVYGRLTFIIRCKFDALPVLSLQLIRIKPVVHRLYITTGVRMDIFFAVCSGYDVSLYGECSTALYHAK